MQYALLLLINVSAFMALDHVRVWRTNLVKVFGLIVICGECQLMA
jgi:hypothetical protein